MIFTKQAAKVIDSVANFVESKNTPGSGKRFATRFIDGIEKYAQPNTQYSLCNDAVLARLKYSCISYNDWVIAFTIKNDVFTIRRIVHNSMIF